MLGYDDYEGMYREMYYCLNNILLLVLDALEDHNYGLAEQIIKNAQCVAEDIFIYWADAQDGDPQAQEFIPQASLEAYKSIYHSFGQKRETLTEQFSTKKEAGRS